MFLGVENCFLCIFFKPNLLNFHVMFFFACSDWGQDDFGWLSNSSENNTRAGEPLLFLTSQEYTG